MTLHHVAVIARSPKRSAKFFTELGFSLHRITVNPHDPHTLQADFGRGPWFSLLFYPRCHKGVVGEGGVSRIKIASHRTGELHTPDGLNLSSVEGEPAILGATILNSRAPEFAKVECAEWDGDTPTTLGYGVVHHLAFVHDDEERRYHYDEMGQLWELVPGSEETLEESPGRLALPESLEARRVELEAVHAEGINLLRTS